MTHSRSRSVTSAYVQTTREQLQQQRFCIFRLTPVKCPHLLSHEMTSQVVSSCCLLLLVFALVLQKNGRRITLQPKLPVATRPTMYMKRLAQHSTLARPIRIKKYITYLAGKLRQVMDVHVVFHVQFEVLLANGIGSASSRNL